MPANERKSSLNRPRSHEGISAVDAQWLENILERFEDAWQRGERPKLEDYLGGTGPQRRALLIELVHEDLEYRIKAGEAARLESYLERYPELRDEPAALIDLIESEFKFRRRMNDNCQADECAQRFPDLGEALAARLNSSAIAVHPSSLIPHPSSHPSSLAEVDTLPPPPPSTGGNSVGGQATPVPTCPGYEIIEELGRGGMGVVYKARQLKPARLVALKMILAGAHADQAELARFRAEAEAVARLQHPGIVQIFEVGEHNGLPYFSLEFVEGGNLHKKLQGAPLPPNAAARLTALLAQAMQAAHEKGILHRDLKPANIFLTPVKEGGVPLDQRAAGLAPAEVHYLPKIGDFGLAKKLEGERGASAPCFTDGEQQGANAPRSPGLTATGAILGTPSYMAPEQAGGKNKEITPATDVYALGAILYELLTGRPPFRAATTLDTILQVISDEPVPPGRLIAKTPRDLETICLKCLHKEPARRYGSASALAQDLERFLSGEPIHARPTGRIERVVKWARRRPALAALLAVSTLAVLVVLAFVAYFTSQLKESNTHLGAALNAKDDALKEVTKERDAKDDALKEVTTQRDAKEQNARELRHSLANSNILVAQALFQSNLVVPARDLLDTVPTQPEKLRNFEWHYLKRQFEGGIFTLYGHTNVVHSVAFSPDGTRLATGSFDKTARLWDARTGAALLELKGGGFSVAFSPDGTRLATGGWDKAQLWDVRTGASLLELKGHRGGVRSVAFSPDGTRLATGSDDTTARLWDARTGAALLELKGHASSVYSVAFSPNGTRLATGSADNTARLWDARTGASLLELKGHTQPVRSVAFSPDGTRLATGSWDVTARLWDARTGAALLELKGHTHFVTSLAFSPDGARLATGSYDNTARLWDARTGAGLLELKGHTHFVTSLAFSPDGARLATGSYDNTAQLWDARTGAALLELKGDASFGASVAFSPDGTRLATGNGDGTARLWDARTGAALLELKGHTDWGSSVAFSPDGTYLATGSADNTARLWDARTGVSLLELKAHTGDIVRSVAFSSDGTRLATGSEDKTARLWDARTGATLLELKGHTGPVTSVAFSPDGSRLATGSYDNTARLWDARTGATLLELKGHTGPVTSVAFSPDGSRLATGSYDNTARLWDSRTGATVLELKGHTQIVWSVAFTPDGTRLATGSFDKTARLWDSRTGASLLELKGHTGPVYSVAFSPDGTRLATVSSDGARLWDARPLAKRQQDLDLIDLDTRLWATRFDPFWHAEQLQACRQAGDWFAALYHVNQLLQRQPDKAALLQDRLAIVAEAVRRDPKDAGALAAQARLLLDAGGGVGRPAPSALDDYRAACKTLADLAGDFKDAGTTRLLASTCVLAPDALSDLQPLMDAFKETMSEKYPEDLRLYGGLLLRAGKAEEAVGYLTRARGAGSGDPRPAQARARNDKSSGAVYEELLLALAYYKVQKPAEARRCLERAIFVLDRQPAAAAAFNLQAGCVSALHSAIGSQLSMLPDNYERMVGWQKWIELQALRREAVQALQK